MEEYIVDDLQSDFEYNDGLGDLLREKEERQFSWIKTILVFTVCTFIIFLLLIFLLQLGQSIFLNPNSVSSDSFQNTHDETAQNKVHNKRLISNNTRSGTIADVKRSVKSDIRQKKVTQKPVSVKQSQSSLKETKELNINSVSRKKSISSSSSSSFYRVIVGTFSSHANATKLKNSLKRKGQSAFVQSYVLSGGQQVFRVQSGAFKIKAQANKHLNMLAKKGFEGFVTQK